MRSHRRPSEATGSPFSPDTISPHSASCATGSSTPRECPSNDLKISESFWKELEGKGVPGKVYYKLQVERSQNINLLPDDVLLEVFDFYRMSGESLCPTRIKTAWNWYELVHVCTRWRRIIFGSPRRLDLQLICTRGTPIRRSLGLWPAFPIVIDFYSDRRFGGTGTIVPVLLGPDDEDNVIAALEHPERVRRVGLNLTHSQLLKVSAAMQKPFPGLTRLRLESFDGNAPVLPDAFLGGSAPRLQNVTLLRVPIPALPTLLSSASRLVQLRLVGVPETGYISPEAMVACLAASTKLKFLWILFQSPTSRPSPRRLPPLTRTDLPALTEFMFRGVSEYLEDFVAQINAPRLEDFKITYFNQLDFQVPQLSQFFRRQETLNTARIYNAYLDFSRRETRIKLTSSYQPPPSHFHGDSPPTGLSLDVRILSEGPDWQASHLTQVLTQCITVLSDVDHLSIDNAFSGPIRLDVMDDTGWPELLSLFTAVKSLLVSEEMVGHITRALDRATSEVVAEPLPALRLLQIWPKYEAVESVEQITSLRRLSSQPILTIVDTQQEFDRLRSLLKKEEKAPHGPLT